MPVTLKSFVRMTWVPNVLIVALVAWVVASNHGLTTSIDKSNEQKLIELEQKGTAVARESRDEIHKLAKQGTDLSKANTEHLDRLEKKIADMEKDRQERYKYWLRWAEKVEREKLKEPVAARDGG